MLGVVALLLLSTLAEGFARTNKEKTVAFDEGIQIGDAANTNCTQTHAGMLRFLSRQLQICDGISWARVHTTPCTCGDASTTMCMELYTDGVCFFFVFESLVQCEQLRCVGNGSNPSLAPPASSVPCGEDVVDECGNAVGQGTGLNLATAVKSDFICGEVVEDACDNPTNLTGTAFNVLQCATNYDAIPCNQPIVDECANDCGTIGRQLCSSCLEIMTIAATNGETLSNGGFVVQPLSTPRRLWCDFVSNGGGWTRVIEIRNNQRVHIGAAAVNADLLGVEATYPWTTGGKLSDAEINAITTLGYWRYGCDAAAHVNTYVRNAQLSWTTVQCNSNNWEMDRTRTGAWVNGERSCYVLSNYGSPGSHTNFAANSAAEGNGCYESVYGWGRWGSVWAK